MVQLIPVWDELAQGLIGSVDPCAAADPLKLDNMVGGLGSEEGVMSKQDELNFHWLLARLRMLSALTPPLPRFHKSSCWR